MLRTKDNKIVVEYNESGWFVDEENGRFFHESDKLPLGYITKTDYDKQCEIKFRKQIGVALNDLHKAIVESNIKTANKHVFEKTMTAFRILAEVEESL